MLPAAELRGGASSVSASHTVISVSLVGPSSACDASAAPAACSDKSSPAVSGGAHRTRLSLCSEPLCPRLVLAPSLWGGALDRSLTETGCTSVNMHKLCVRCRIEHTMTSPQGVLSLHVTELLTKEKGRRSYRGFIPNCWESMSRHWTNLS